MRRIIVWNLMTLDGHFEGPQPWDLDFHNLAWGPELERLSLQQAEEGDLLVFGRRTYEGMAAYWTTAEDNSEIKAFMNSVAKLVASRTLKEASWNNSRIVAEPVAELTRLKAGPGKAMLVFGSAELAAVLIEAGLVDELRICIVPVLLGAGNPLFKPAPSRTLLELLGSETTEAGSVILRYAPERRPAS